MRVSQSIIMNFSEKQERAKKKQNLYEGYNGEK